MKDREIKPTPSSAVIIQELKPQYPDEKEISPPDASLYILTNGVAADLIIFHGDQDYKKHLYFAELKEILIETSQKYKITTIILDLSTTTRIGFKQIYHDYLKPYFPNLTALGIRTYASQSFADYDAHADLNCIIDLIANNTSIRELGIHGYPIRHPSPARAIKLALIKNRALRLIDFSECNMSIKACRTIVKAFRPDRNHTITKISFRSALKIIDSKNKKRRQ